MDEVLEAIEVFIIKNDWGGTERLNEDTSVEEDMGISGLDAVDFITDYAREFNVDITEFDYAKYFYAEGGVDLINAIANLFRKKEDRINNPSEKLTLRHLAEGVMKGKLV